MEIGYDFLSELIEIDLNPKKNNRNVSKCDN